MRQLKYFSGSSSVHCPDFSLKACRLVCLLVDLPNWVQLVWFLNIEGYSSAQLSLFSIGLWFLSCKALCLKRFETGCPGGPEVKDADHVIEIFSLHVLSVLYCVLYNEGNII